MSHSQDMLDAIAKLDGEIKVVLTSKTAWYKKIDGIVRLIVPQVEQIGETWKGTEKKALALELVDDLWFRFVDLKWIPNELEKLILKTAASFAIDSAVRYFNEKGIFKHKAV